nr:PREDICTED: uncharacterized protein LOC107077949 isoform X1 [Lepisosteus oculatus]XP_015207396.1 PREDICTED: uncharacterized protein LOC107077949 isoform X1 [Lepisosteus oculatus]XP_015207397.1 PREDICTED: uncharacterized protein LOC107077949 isoform X1 [Lepisosteus oculatus]XP_015207399.1 PREDICTED: uncharacterized protein LOC107077949 isoform X1 [Lepisosteus oculatus]XP_015207400.1 PREDICTED: uncharacterized protein LOC107077949 isoform X1 [Lepisosteus oculatus]XP_015207401.1 PREDICTED: unch
MQARQRALPAWMVRRREEREAGSTETRAPSPQRGKRKRAERVTVYCMNEAELVKTAMDFLAGRRGPATVGKAPEESTTGSCKKEQRNWVSDSDLEEEEDLADSEPSDRSHVSESDLDGVAEEETIPIIGSGGCQAEDKKRARMTDTQLVTEGQRDAEQMGQPAPGETTQPGENSPGGDSEDDALRLVREIFFTRPLLGETDQSPL